MKTSTLLKRAEKYLWDGRGECPRHTKKHEFICHAVYAAAEVVPDTFFYNYQWLSRLIVNRLGHNTYTTWAVKRGLLPEWYGDEFWPLIQANRLRWLRELQREFKAKGD